MTPLKQIQYSKIRDYFLNILRHAAERLFFTFLVLIFISLLISSFVFYKYYILPQRIEPISETKAIKFQENVYKKILQEWQNRGERFEAATTKKYPDPLWP